MENSEHDENSGVGGEPPGSVYTRRQLVERIRNASAVPMLVALSMSWTDIAAAYS
jgi:hypothetical protein